MANEQHPLMGALGLCRKAGKLLHGYDRVQENALRGKVALVLLTADASERTVKHMKDQRPAGYAYPETRRRVRHYRRTPCAAVRKTSYLIRRTTIYGF